MACSIEATSTEDMGFKLEVRRADEMDMRLLDIDECEERAEAIEDEGELERGVEMSELDVLYEKDAIGTIACEDGGGDKRKGVDEDESEGRARDTSVGDENAAGPRRAGTRCWTGCGGGGSYKPAAARDSTTGWRAERAPGRKLFRLLSDDFTHDEKLLCKKPLAPVVVVDVVGETDSRFTTTTGLFKTVLGLL